jgi:hypothetical protein
VSAVVDLDRTRHLLEETGFEHVPHVLPEVLERGVKEKLPVGGFLELVCTTERDFREERRVRTSLTATSSTSTAAASGCARSNVSSAMGSARADTAAQAPGLRPSA